MLAKLRPRLKGLSLVLARPFAAMRIHPNIVSLLAVPLALAYSFFVQLQLFHWALLFALLAVAMDFIDGAVAKLLGRQTFFGNYFETMVDKVVDFILLGSFALLFPLATVLALGFSFLSSYAKPRVALVIITDNRDWPAVGEHADKLVLLLAGLAFAGFQPVLAGFAVMEAVLYLIAFISFIGAIQRIAYARGLIKEAEQKGRILPYLKKGLGHKAEKA